MSRNEVNDTFGKYGIYDGKGVTVFSNSDEINKLCWFFEYGKPVPFEKPDAYIKAENKILIIEHFAIDGYEIFPDGGSKLIRNEKMIDRKFSDIPATEEGVHLTSSLGVSNTYQSFIENCKYRFNHHYNKIDSYKDHLRDEKIANKETQFTVCFLMDEVSPLGTCTHDGEKICPVCLGRSKEFLNFFGSKADVDWIISAVVLPSGHAPYFFSQNEIEVCKLSVLDYARYQFLSSNPMRMDTKIIVPEEE